jgi:hypothetical protein
MSRRKPCRLLACLLFVVSAASADAQQRVSEDRDLLEIDLTGWDCLDRPGGTAKTDDGAERNAGKNRPFIDVGNMRVPQFDTAGFLRHVSAFDAQTRGKRRSDLTAPQRAELAALEKQIVSLTAYMVIVYAGPPESTNCGSIDFHDWHLELFEKPLDHAPTVGDPTPIICETTPRVQTPLFRSGVRLQKLAGFFRRPDIETEQLPQKPQRVRITGYLLWDDDHNGKADIGNRIERVLPNKYHQPWRSTPWEIHPVLKIESAEGPFSAPPPDFPESAATVASQSAAPRPAAATTATPAATMPPPAQEVTVLEPVKVRIRYGEIVLQPGTKLPLVKRDSSTVTVKYMEQNVYLPLHATDQR